MLRYDRKIIDAEFIWESFGNYFWNIEQTIDMGVEKATWGWFFSESRGNLSKLMDLKRISKIFGYI